MTGRFKNKLNYYLHSNLILFKIEYILVELKKSEIKTVFLKQRSPL